MSKRILFASGSVIAAMTVRVSVAATLTAITPPDVTTIRPTGVSDDGRTVSGYLTGSQNTAFRYTAGVLQTLDDLPGGASNARAEAISGDGKTIVGRGAPSTGFMQAARWSGDDSNAPVALLPAAPAEARGVSRDGSVIVGQSSAGTSTEAFRWTAATGVVGLGDLPGGDNYSSGSAVSADGSTTVGYSHSANGYEAFRWTATGGMVGLGDLAGSARDTFYSYATAVSADGGTIVGRGYRDLPADADDSGGYQAVRWTADDGIQSLGHLPFSRYSAATGVSADGTTIVGRVDDLGGHNAFIWTASGGMQNLWDVLLVAGINPADQGWDWFYTATAISGDGSTIIGYGSRYSVDQGFVIVLPEPGILLIVLIASCGFGRRRVTRSKCPRTSHLERCASSRSVSGMGILPMSWR